MPRFDPLSREKDFIQYSISVDETHKVVTDYDPSFHSKSKKHYIRVACILLGSSNNDNNESQSRRYMQEDDENPTEVLSFFFSIVNRTTTHQHRPRPPTTR